MSLRLLFNEIMKINRDREGVFENQAHIEIPDESNPLELIVVLTPRYGEFKGAEVRFKMSLPPTFPNSPPRVQCLTKIFHCNISGTSVCFNLFSSEFKAGMPLSTYVVGLLWFLDNPNPDSPLNSSCVQRDTEKRLEAIRTAMNGGNGYQAHKNLNPDKDLAIYFLELEFMDYLLQVLEKRSRVPLTELRETEADDVSRPKNCDALDELASLNGFLHFHERQRGICSIKSRLKILAQTLGEEPDADEVVKEVVFLVERDGEKFPVLVFTAGYHRVDLSSVATCLGVELSALSLPTRLQAAQHCDLTKISFFDITTWPKNASVIVNQDLVYLDRIFLQRFNGIFVELSNPEDILTIHPPSRYILTPLTYEEEPLSNEYLTGHDKRAQFYFGDDFLSALTSRPESRVLEVSIPAIEVAQ